MLNLNREYRYLLACSFGPDSMALFDMLEKEGFCFDVAIVNYHLRVESDIEVESLKKYCMKSNHKLFVFDVKNVPTKNIEEECRNIRYNFFKKLIDENGYNVLLTGHHQDDLIETYLMQKKRQILPIFYGIDEKTFIFGIDVWRPLLSFSKSDLLNYCNNNNVPFMIDKSNFDTTILRNKFRHEIIKNLTNENRLAILKEIEKRNAELRAILDSIDRTRINDVEYLKTLNTISIYYALNMVSQPLSNRIMLGKRQCNEIIKIIYSKKANVIAKIKGKLFVKKEYERISFIEFNSYEEYSYILEKRDIYDTPYFYFDCKGDTKNRNVKDGDFPLVVRNIRENDRYIIKNYSCSVKRLFIDWKMPVSIRKVWPIIVNKNGSIIYIPRYRKDFTLDESVNFFVKIN